MELWGLYVFWSSKYAAVYEEASDKVLRVFNGFNGFVHFRDDFDVANRSGSVMKADSDEVIYFLIMGLLILNIMVTNSC